MAAADRSSEDAATLDDKEEVTVGGFAVCSLVVLSSTADKGLRREVEGECSVDEVVLVADAPSEPDLPLTRLSKPDAPPVLPLLFSLSAPRTNPNAIGHVNAGQTSLSINNAAELTQKTPNSGLPPRRLSEALEPCDDATAAVSLSAASSFPSVSALRDSINILSPVGREVLVASICWKSREAAASTDPEGKEVLDGGSGNVREECSKSLGDEARERKVSATMGDPLFTGGGDKLKGGSTELFTTTGSLPPSSL